MKGIDMSNLEEEYIRDKKYIHETLESNTKHLEKLNDKFDVSINQITKQIAVIETKLVMYVSGISLVFGLLWNGIAYLMGK
jgi:cell division protein ZapA (FtsZ GTPase activity inhibitor)